MAESLAEMTDEALVHGALQEEHDLVAARFKHSMGQLENTAKLRYMRRRIATLRTETRRRERANDLPKDSLLHKHGLTFGATVASSDTEAPQQGGFLSGIVDKLTESS